MKYLCILIVYCSITFADVITIESILTYEGRSSTLFVKPVENSDGVVTALLNEKELLRPDESRELLYRFEDVPDYVLYEEGTIYTVKDSTLLVVSEKGEQTYAIPDNVSNIVILTDNRLLLQSGFGLRLSKLYYYSLKEKVVLESLHGYGSWVLDESYCYFIEVDSNSVPVTTLNRVNRKSGIIEKEWAFPGSPRAHLAMDTERLWILSEPQSSSRSLQKLELYMLDLKSDLLTKKEMPFTAGGFGDVNGDILALKDSKYDLAIASYGAKQLYLVSPETTESLQLNQRGGFGRYYTNSLYQKGLDLYVMFGGKLCLVDLEKCRLKQSIHLKQCDGIVGGEESAFLLFHNKIDHITHRETPLVKPLVRATPWQFGGDLGVGFSSDDPWRFGEGRATIEMVFPKRRLVSQITLLDCDVDTITRVHLIWKGGSVDITNACASTFNGNVSLPNSTAFYSEFLQLEIDTKSDSVSTIGGIVLE